MKISVGKQKSCARYCVYAYFATKMKLKSAHIHFAFFARITKTKWERKYGDKKKPNWNNDSPFKSTASGIPFEWLALKTFKLNFSSAQNTFYRWIFSFCHSSNGNHKWRCTKWILCSTEIVSTKLIPNKCNEGCTIHTHTHTPTHW